jgi:biotin carboxylase
MHTTSYGAVGFVEACRRAGAAAAVASDRCHVLDRAWAWSADALVIDFAQPDQAADVIAAAARAQLAPVDAVLPVGGEAPARVAALAAERLGLPANAPEAMVAAGNKLVMRRRIQARGGDEPELRQPRFLAVARDAEPGAVAQRILETGGVGFPCVVKPLALSGSRGVIRADDPTQLARALARLGRLLDDPALRRLEPEASQQILIESFIPGPELALEGLLTDGLLDVLAMFDKPDPLDGPYFEETIYLTPSGLAAPEQERIARAVSAAARALGLSTGPIHAEVRLSGVDRLPTIVEVAARPIGGLCARSLQFDGGLTLEDVVVRHALGHRPRPPRDPRPSGVMMIPIPTRVPAALRGVRGVEEARAVPGISDVVLAARVGETVTPLPEGASYLGFIFAAGETPAAVDESLRRASDCLAFSFAPLIPVTTSTPLAVKRDH